MTLTEKLVVAYLACGVIALLAMLRDWDQIVDWAVGTCVGLVVWLLWPIALTVDIVDTVRRRRRERRPLGRV